MGSRRGFFQEIQRQQRLAAQQQARHQRAIEREQRQAEQARKAYEKQQRADYITARKAQVDAYNRNLAEQIRRITGLLVLGLGQPERFDLATARAQPAEPTLNLGVHAMAEPQPVWEQFAPATPGRLSRFTGGNSQYQAALRDAQHQFDLAQRAHAGREAQRATEIARIKAEHKRTVSALWHQSDEENARLDDHRRGVADRIAEDVIWLAEQALGETPLPQDFPRSAEFAFDHRTDMLRVRLELPSLDVVPIEREFRYVQASDDNRVLEHTRAQLNELYAEVIAQTVLLSIRDLFAVDPALRAVSLDGHIHRNDPATGALRYPRIVSTTVEREQFPPDTNLVNVEPQACLRSFNTLISKHPYQVEPVAPTLDFDWDRYRFVGEYDAAATLDARPDLMDMSPTEFEHLVRQIFQAQGAEGWTTHQSKDDGVDAVIAKRTPLIGGLAIVQAKKYKGVVGVNHIRELAGAMEEKKAGWGILITTSWFTTGCWEKAREHGRMELIDGDRLVHLIKEHLNKDVLVGAPRPRHRPGPPPPNTPIVT
ncbi:restriction endonuclease [Nocardia testacea]|uniref:restriction endonuclease n=1 Tax=Nocardia testacea TaxID=248551 RepID=UPI003C2D0794